MSRHSDRCAGFPLDPICNRQGIEDKNEHVEMGPILVMLRRSEYLRHAIGDCRQPRCPWGYHSKEARQTKDKSCVEPFNCHRVERHAIAGTARYRSVNCPVAGLILSYGMTLIKR